MDVVKYDETFDIHMWTQGKITAINDVVSSKGSSTKEFMVKYLKDFKVGTAAHEADSQTIAPLYTFTKDEMWREQLKKGDMVDVLLTKSKKWVHATVTVPEQRTEEDIMPIIKVGYRVYDPNGDKKDEMGSYFTTADEYDEMVGSFTVRVQPKGSMT